MPEEVPTPLAVGVKTNASCGVTGRLLTPPVWVPFRLRSSCPGESVTPSTLIVLEISSRPVICLLRPTPALPSPSINVVSAPPVGLVAIVVGWKRVMSLSYVALENVSRKSPGSTVVPPTATGCPTSVKSLMSLPVLPGLARRMLNVPLP